MEERERGKYSDGWKSSLINASVLELDQCVLVYWSFVIPIPLQALGGVTKLSIG
jgi:hypothetical protein